jgi:hypothetical protein
MARFNYSFNIPDSIWRFRWENIKNYSMWIFNPHRCYVCNKRLQISSTEVEYNFKTKNGDKSYNDRVMAQWSVERDWKSIDYHIPPEHICVECLAECVKDENAVPKRGISKFGEDDLKNKCDCCGSKKKSYKWTSFKIPSGKTAAFILGNYCSWNSAHYCAECIRHAIVFGDKKSSIFTYWYGKRAHIQQNGLPVVDNKVRFPER